MLCQPQQHLNNGSELDLPTTTTTNTSLKFDFGKCKVCRDKATGIHYGIPSCEGCKGFYKRSIDKHEKYACSFGGAKCTLTPRQRRKCKFCRWKSCVDAGMSFNAIKMGRISKAQKEKVKSQIDHDPINIVIADSSTLVSPSPSPSTVATKGIQTLTATSHFDSSTLVLNHKCNLFYLEYISDVIPLLERAHECLKHNKPAPLPVEHLDQTLIQLIWQQCLTKMNENANRLVLYVKKLPGFAELDLYDFAALLADHTKTLLGIRMNKTFIDDEQFFMIMQNIRFTKALASRLMGPTIVEKVFEFNYRLNALKLRDSEIALLIPYVMSSPDGIVLQNLDSVKKLNELYKRALLDEFGINKRSQEFIEELVETLKSLPFHANCH